MQCILWISHLFFGGGGGFSSGPRVIIVQPLQVWYKNISQGIFRNATVFCFFFNIYEGIFFTLALQFMSFYKLPTKAAWWQT